MAFRHHKSQEYANQLLQLAILLLGGIVVGPIFDKRGSRILMIPGALIVLISFLINIFTQDFIALVIAQGVLCGIGNGLL
jgi:MFS family permease